MAASPTPRVVESLTRFTKARLYLSVILITPLARHKILFESVKGVIFTQKTLPEPF